MMVLDASSEAVQEQLGTALSHAVAAECVIYLHGELGAGKTTLTRGFLGGALHRPTYTLMEPYCVDGRNVYHLDLYRLTDPGELEYLGIRDLLGERAVLLVEWPERGEGALPPADLVVDIRYLGSGRRLALSAHTASGRDVLNRMKPFL